MKDSRDRCSKIHRHMHHYKAPAGGRYRGFQKIVVAEALSAHGGALPDYRDTPLNLGLRFLTLR